ncbi:hypothetical protein M9H77_20887 [Catharanthus roseus]|uniref:Uncharacterized protein n=1 Tax=Catharanthus roseus TaxID=4058 RepID=A0ACC0ALW5_CATRO|nr:hypothetical protein M9H77_20887 [Catharanthus roseus]
MVSCFIEKESVKLQISQNVLAKLTELVKDEEVVTRFVLYFGLETTNHAETEHSVLKLWLSTCHGDSDTMFLNIKSSLEISKLKEKFKAKSNAILKNISNHISHWTLKKIWLEIKRTREIVDDAQNKCSHYLRKLHRLPCVCELFGRYEHFLPLQLEDVSVFWRTLEIGVDAPSAHARDIDFEIRDLASMLDQISTGPISKVMECCRLIKRFFVPYRLKILVHH